MGSRTHREGVWFTLILRRCKVGWAADSSLQFGGDPDRVTIFGESAGAGVVLHQVSALSDAVIRNSAEWQ